MRRLFRALLGGQRSEAPDAALEHSDMKPEESPFQAVFRVPGMT